MTQGVWNCTRRQWSFEYVYGIERVGFSIRVIFFERWTHMDLVFRRRLLFGAFLGSQTSDDFSSEYDFGSFPVVEPVKL